MWEKIYVNANLDFLGIRTSLQNLLYVTLPKTRLKKPLSVRNSTVRRILLHRALIDDAPFDVTTKPATKPVMCTRFMFRICLVSEWRQRLDRLSIMLLFLTTLLEQMQSARKPSGRFQVRVVWTQVKGIVYWTRRRIRGSLTFWVFHFSLDMIFFHIQFLTWFVCLPSETEVSKIVIKCPKTLQSLNHNVLVQLATQINFLFCFVFWKVH